MHTEFNENDFLAEIHRGAKMGVDTIETILPKVKDTELLSELSREQDEYKKLQTEASTELTLRSASPHPLSKLQEAGAWFGIQFNTLADASSSHIAEMMMQGTNMGVIGITRSLNSHPESEQKVKDMASRFIKIQEDNINKLKTFLN